MRVDHELRSALAVVESETKRGMASNDVAQPAHGGLPMLGKAQAAFQKLCNGLCGGVGRELSPGGRAIVRYDQYPQGCDLRRPWGFRKRYHGAGVRIDRDSVAGKMGPAPFTETRQQRFLSRSPGTREDDGSVRRGNSTSPEPNQVGARINKLTGDFAR